MLLKILSIREVKFPSVINLVGVRMHCLKQTEDMMFKKLIDKSVLLNKFILKSANIQLVLLSHDILWRICRMFSKKLSRLLTSGGLYITPFITFYRLVSSITPKIDSKLPYIKILKSGLSTNLYILWT